MQGREISVNGNSYFMPFVRLKLEQVRAKIVANPRFNSLRKRPTTLDQMWNELEEDKRFQRLRESVISNRGITEPLIVEETDIADIYNLREGFQRRLIYDRCQNEPWAQYIPVYILPADMPEQDRHRYIQTIHNVGKSDWDKITKVIDALSYQDKFGGTDAEIAEANGYEGGETEYRFHVMVWKRCKDYVKNTNDQDYRWSHWFEILKASETVSQELSKKIEAQKKSVYKIINNRIFSEPKKSRVIRRLVNNPQALLGLSKLKQGDTEGVQNILQVNKPSRQSSAKTTVNKWFPEITARMSKRHKQLVTEITGDKRTWRQFLQQVTKLAVDSNTSDIMAAAVLKAAKK